MSVRGRMRRRNALLEVVAQAQVLAAREDDALGRALAQRRLARPLEARQDGTLQARAKNKQTVFLERKVGRLEESEREGQRTVGVLHVLLSVCTRSVSGDAAA